jgi:hypothetical protein
MTEEKNYMLVEVPTGSALAFKTPSDEVLTTEQVLVEILNKLDSIQKALA